MALLLLSGCTSALINPVSGPPLADQESATHHRAIRFPARSGALTARSHIELEGWFMPAQRPRGTIVFADGAENIRHHIDKVDWLPARGYNVLLFNYRGYGASAGEQTLAGFHNDLRAAIRKADRIDRLPRRRLIVFGQSLGGAIATVVAANMSTSKDWGALVVDSGPSSYRSVVRENLANQWYTWPFQIPLSLLVTDRFEAEDAAPKLPAIPKLWIANPGDQTVGAHHGERLYQRASAPKALWRIEPRPHIQTFRPASARAAFVDWLDRALTEREALPPPMAQPPQCPQATR